MFLFAWAVSAPLWGQYGGFGGPSILSRGGNSGSRAGSRPIGFRPFAGVSGNYYTNLNLFNNATSANSFTTGDSFGATATAGLQGYKSTARSSTAVDMLLSYYWVSRQGASRGLSESLNVTHSRQISRRVMWFVGANGQSTNRSVVFANQRFSPDPVPELTPQNEEIFDTRTYRGMAATGFSFQKSARLSFSAQGAAFGAERRSARLADSRGFMGSGTAQYSLSRRQFVGATFTYGTFYFPGSFGETSYYAPQGFYGVSINQAWSFQVMAGVFRAKTTRLTSVALDPFIAELTGQRTALEIFNGNNMGFSGGAGISGRLRDWSVGLTAMRGINPGNGVYLTNQMTSVNLNLGHDLGRSASWALFARAAETKALTQQIGNARYYSAGTSLSYRLNGYLSLVGNASLYRTEAAGQRIKLDRFSASVGLYFSPGELPIHVF